LRAGLITQKARKRKGKNSARGGKRIFFVPLTGEKRQSLKQVKKNYGRYQLIGGREQTGRRGEDQHQKPVGFERKLFPKSLERASNHNVHRQGIKRRGKI